MRVRNLAGSAVVTVLVLIAAGLSALASADSPAESTPETRTITLQPGDNFIGWVSETLPVTELFGALPQIEVVYFWDAGSRAWRMAAPALPERLWTLRSIAPGMAVQIRIAGDELVDWQRPLAPARGKVKLHPGENWVAWSGPDDWPLDEVARGVGAALARIEHGAFLYEPTSVANEHGQRQSELSAVARGDALRVTVSRSVNWLQPTGMLPRIVFLGDATTELQEAVRADVEIVMNYYASEFGIQLDGTDSSVYIVEDVEDLIAYRGLEDEAAEHLRSFWLGAGAWVDQSFGVILKFETWGRANTDEYEAHGDGTLGRYFLAHEFFHRLQHQLSDGSVVPNWLLEGAAVWVDAALRHRESGAAFADILAKRHKIAFDDGPRLDNPEAESGVWVYHLGALAVNRLAQQHGGDAVMEIWRSLSPRGFGPLGRWRSTPPWESVFAEVLGVEPEEFYAEFNAWLGRPADETSAADAEPGDAPAPRIEGTLTGPDGAGLPFVRVVAQGKTHAYALTAADGSYSLAVPAAGRYHVYVDLNYCTVSYHRSGVAGRWNRATMVYVRQTSVGDIDLHIPGDACTLQISGNLMDADGAAVPNVWISASGPAGHGGGESDAHGAFTITVPDVSWYRLSVHEFGCTLYDTGRVATTKRSAARRITLRSDITGIEFRLPEDPASVCQ